MKRSDPDLMSTLNYPLLHGARSCSCRGLRCVVCAVSWHLFADAGGGEAVPAVLGG